MRHPRHPQHFAESVQEFVWERREVFPGISCVWTPLVTQLHLTGGKCHHLLGYRVKCFCDETLHLIFFSFSCLINI